MLNFWGVSSKAQKNGFLPAALYATDSDSGVPKMVAAAAIGTTIVILLLMVRKSGEKTTGRMVLKPCK